MASSEKIFQDGVSALSRRDMADSERLFRKFLKRHPSHVPALNLVTVALMSAGRFGEAEEFIARAVRLDRTSDASFSNYGLILRQLGRSAQALEQFDSALLLNPQSAETWNNRGTVLNDLQRYDEALAAFDRAISLNADYWEALANRGKPLVELRRFDEALATFDRAVTLKPDLVQVWIGRGYVFAELGRFADAEAAYDKALSIDPNLPEAWLGRGKFLADVGRSDEALANFEKAAALRKDFAEAYWNIAFLRLTLGHYAEGWPLYEWRWKWQYFTSPVRPFKKPLWLGEPDLAGKTLLVHAEQGLGDTIQFARYVRLLKEKNCHIVFEVQAPLVPLLRGQIPDVDVVAYGSALPPFDFHCPLLSLPLAFGTTLETIPAEIPYLATDPEKVRIWRDRLGTSEKLKIGLVWSGNPNFQKDHQRRIRLETLAPLIDGKHEWYALQKDIHDYDRDTLGKMPQINNLSETLVDFSDTAAVVSLMDVIVSVDTSVAHLAGALGKPVWVLLGFNADFRWLRQRADSPWYPTAKLFRQRSRGDWNGVVAAVSAELDKLQT